MCESKESIGPGVEIISYEEIPQTELAMGGSDGVAKRGLERSSDPGALPASIFPYNLQYFVTPTLKNT